SAQYPNRGIQSVHLLCCFVPLSLQLRDYVHVFLSGRGLYRRIRQTRSGRLVFPRLTSHHLPVTLSKSLRYWNAQPTYSVWPRIAMRSLTWVSDKHLTGWACSACDWTFPLPSLLRGPEAKKGYDRLASPQFQRHDYDRHPPTESPSPDDFLT